MFGTSTGGGSHHHHGYKRRAVDRENETEAPGTEQPITKRLARMRIGEPASLLSVSNNPGWAQGARAAPAGAARQLAVDKDEDYMFVDESKDKIYIHDLESEIAGIEEAEERSKNTLFLADIDKKISAIPQRLLQNKAEQGGATDTQMVLYHVPSSISVPEDGEDHVRNAILAARMRAREHQLREAQLEREEETGRQAEQRGHGQGQILASDLMVDPVEEEEMMEDADAMDLG